jgi:hypothetical protein
MFSIRSKIRCPPLALKNALLSLTAAKHPLLRHVGGASDVFELSDWYPAAGSYEMSSDDLPLVTVHRVRLAQASVVSTAAADEDEVDDGKREEHAAAPAPLAPKAPVRVLRA